MRPLVLGPLGGVVPRFGGVDGGGVPGGRGVEVLKYISLGEFEGSVEGFEGGVRHSVLPVVARVFIAESGVRR
jgi:hypothetical protein